MEDARQSDLDAVTAALSAREAVVNRGTPNGYATLDSVGKVPIEQLPAGSGGGGPIVGQAIVPFAAWQSDDSVVVTGQSGLSMASRIWACVYADTGEAALEQWAAPIIRDVAAGIGFTVALRPEWGTHKGPVTVHWGYA